MTHPKRQDDAFGLSAKDDTTVNIMSANNSGAYRELFEDPKHKKSRRRQRRRIRMAAGGVGGFVVGGALLGPVGACAGCVSGVAMSRAASRVGERWKDDRLQREMSSHTLLV
eukprot:CAMPEP_0119557212 /NCGR_PEP_ID=MMETSP1352-20130426/8948_1 /TAXON_ID=265584 /ORGANISM="Stauroneis constricta, Strain CCMP1120" /LENGTH=111 /DNA_ID=CAMNT_0007604279 /DNA_START=139 /DNA_END=474 /DNA_ORIENTATION=-